MLGLKRRFRGNIDHLESTLQEQPIPDTPAVSKQFLILYDRVPGGTGYLKELVDDGQSMMDMFADVLEALKGCPCRLEPDKDGCYRCLYAYRSSRDMKEISRATAIELLTSILDRRDKLIVGDTVTKINQNVFLDSELEVYFIEALSRAKFGGQPTSLKKEIVRHKSGWYFNIQDRGYHIAPQVELTQADGIPIATTPDLVFYPERERDCRPIAVYLDGFSTHAKIDGSPSRVGDDMAKRMGLIRSGRFWVWSLTWNDVKNQIEPVKDFYTPFLKKGSTESKFRNSLSSVSNVSALGSAHDVPSLELFLRFLSQPDEVAWRANAFVHSMMWIDFKASDVEVQRSAIREFADVCTTPAGVKVDLDATDLLAGRVDAMDDHDESLLKLWTWTTKAAIGAKDTSVVDVLCWLQDISIGEVAEYRRNWNGYLRLHNIMQFIPGCVFVSAQGVADASHAVLEFVDVAETPMDQLLEEQDLSDYAGLVEAPILRALEQLVAAEIEIPDASEIPYELSDAAGEILGQAELGWEDRKLAVVMSDDEISMTAFRDAGWSVVTEEQFAENAIEIFNNTKPGDTE